MSHPERRSSSSSGLRVSARYRGDGVFAGVAAPKGEGGEQANGDRAARPLLPRYAPRAVIVSDSGGAQRLPAGA